MASNPIQAVLFDMGGTLEHLYYDEIIRQDATASLGEFLHGLGLEPCLALPELQSTVETGLRSYQAWRERSERELPAEEVWADYVFTDRCTDRARLMAVADDIAFFYETHFYVRRLRAEVPAALEALHQSGFRLAVISNVLSRRLVPSKLAEYGIARYFDPVVTSADLGWRKPNVRIFEEACHQMGLPPAVCAYVGDTVSRDVVGARRAGFGLAIQIRSFLTDRSDNGVASVLPDAVIHSLTEVVDLVSRPAGVVHGH